VIPKPVLTFATKGVMGPLSTHPALSHLPHDVEFTPLYLKLPFLSVTLL